MKRYWPLLLIAILLAAVIGVSEYAESAKEKCEQSASMVNAVSVAKGNDSKPINHADARCEPPIWAKYFTWPEGVGAWVVVFTLFVIAWQSVETANAAEVGRASIRLQELTMQQSAYLVNWKVKRLKSDPRKLRLTVDIVNQGDFPMTLSEGNLVIEEVGGYATYSIGKATFLPANTPVQIEIVVAAAPEQLNDFEQGSLRIQVRGVFSHLDRISGKQIDQPINGWLECGRWGTQFHWELHMNPIESELPKTT